MGRQPGARRALAIAGTLAVLGAVRGAFSARSALLGDPERGTRGRGPSGQDAAAMRRDLVTYGVGYALALVLTCCAFAAVRWHWTSGAKALALVYALALVQAIVHFRCFLHVGLRRSARDDLQLILFSTVIIALMVGGTLVVLFNLRTRMM